MFETLILLLKYEFSDIRSPYMVYIGPTSIPALRGLMIYHSALSALWALAQRDVVVVPVIFTADVLPQQTQNICITFAQRRPNVFDIGPKLYKCYTNVLCLLGRCRSASQRRPTQDYAAVAFCEHAHRRMKCDGDPGGYNASLLSSGTRALSLQTDLSYCSARI